MKSMFVVAFALLVAAQANSVAQEKEAKTVRVIVFSPQVPGTDAGKIAKAIKTGAFTEIAVDEPKSTPVKLKKTAGTGEKPTLETYQRQKISVSLPTKGEKYIIGDVYFPMSMTKGFKLTKFVERGTFTGKMGDLMSHHYIIYEATIIRP